MQRSKEIVAYAASFTGPVAGNAFLAMVGVLATEWNTDENLILLAIPAFMFPFAIVQLFSGYVSTAYDRRVTLSLGLVVYIVGSLGAAASPSLSVFLVTRVVQGVGYAFVAPVLVPIAFEVAGRDRQGLAMGYLGSTSTAGVTVGPLLGGYFAEYNWRLAFVAIALMAFVVLVAVAIVFRGEKQVGRRGTSREFTKEVVSTVKNRDVALLLITGFTVFASFIGVISFLSVHLDAEGYGSGAIGFALMFSGLSGVFLSPIAGKLVDSKGTRCCVSLGLLIAGVATFAMYDLDAYIGYIALLAIMGFGSSFIWSALLTMLMRASPASRDTSSPVFNSARFTGYALSTMLLAPVYESSGFGAVILICGAANVFCLVLVLGTRRSLDRG